MKFAIIFLPDEEHSNNLHILRNRIIRVWHHEARCVPVPDCYTVIGFTGKWI